MSGTHGNITSAIRFTYNHRHFGYSSFTVSIQNLGTMADHTGMFLIHSRQITRKIDKCYDWNIESITIPDKTCRFIGRIHIQHASQEYWLVSYKTDSTASHTSETNHQIKGPSFHNLKEIGIIHYCLYYIPHIIRKFRIRRDNIFNLIIPFWRLGSDLLWFLFIIPRDKRKQFLYLTKTLFFIFCKEMCISRDGTMNACSPKIFHGNIFAQHRLDHTGPGNKHFGNIVHHKYKISQCGRIYSTSSTRS